MSERARWEALAATQPYWTVLVDERYRAERMGEEDRRAFFDSGAREMSRTLATIRSHLAPHFRARSALDYGCGVGRLTIPIARESDRVLGVDVSQRMVDTALRNSQSAGVTNVDFMQSERFLDAADAVFSFDFVHSYIVFQHIPVREGMRITEVMLRRLAPGGVGALHYNVGRHTSVLQRAVNAARSGIPGVNAVVNILRGRPMAEPMVPVFDYDLRALLRLLERHGCQAPIVKHMQHGRFSGAMLIFRKPV